MLCNRTLIPLRCQVDNCNYLGRYDIIIVMGGCQGYIYKLLIYIGNVGFKVGCGYG